jgi:hypothetical protein
MNIFNTFYSSIVSNDDSNILNIKNWLDIGISSEGVKLFINKCEIIENNLDLEEYRLFVKNNFYVLFSLIIKFYYSYHSKDIKNIFFFKGKYLIKNNIINIEDFVKIIKKYKSDNYCKDNEANKAIFTCQFYMTEYIFNLQNKSEIEIYWNKYFPIFENSPLIILNNYKNITEYNLISEEQIKKIFLENSISFIMFRCMQYVSCNIFFSNYLKICEKYNINQKEIETELNGFKYNSESALKGIYATYYKFNPSYKYNYYEKIQKYNPKKLNNYLTDNEIQEYYRLHCPKNFNYILIDEIIKKQDLIDKKLDLILEKLDIKN